MRNNKAEFYAGQVFILDGYKRMKRLIVSLFLALHIAAVLASPLIAGHHPTPQAMSGAVGSGYGLSEYGYKGWQQGACIYVETDQCDSGE